MGVLISSQPLDALHSLSFAGVRVHSIYDVFLEWVRIGIGINLSPPFHYQVSVLLLVCEG